MEEEPEYMSVESVAMKLRLEPGWGGAYQGPNPFESGATEDGFILFPAGNAWDRKLDKSYPRDFVERYCAGIKGDFTVSVTGNKPVKGTSYKSPKKEPIDWSLWKRTEWLYNKDGKPYSKVTRLDPPYGLLKPSGKPYGKTYRQSTYVGGHWINKSPEIPILYEHDKVVSSRRIFVVEGEKAADSINSRLGGISSSVATTNPGGTGNSRMWYQLSSFMKGKIVIIIPDNDEPGRKHARLVAELSRKAQAKSIQVVSLPNLEEKGDVADYFDKGNTMRDLLNYIKEN